MILAKHRSKKKKPNEWGKTELMYLYYLYCDLDIKDKMLGDVIQRNNQDIQQTRDKRIKLSQ